VYIAPDETFSATYPSILRRFGAGAIDWVLCSVAYLIASIVAGLFQALGMTSREEGDLGGIPGTTLIVVSQLIVAAPIVAYFAYYWMEGSTLGMRAVDIELVREVTARPPGWKRAVPRAILAFLVALALVNVYFASSARPYGEAFTSYERALVVVSIAVAAVGLAAKAWILVDPCRRSAFDRLFGIVYVEEFVFTNAPRSPWTEGIR
jgi:uncharacterized RDD family membrane protein YckC